MDARERLKHEIASLRFIIQELNQYYATTVDLDAADTIRQQRDRVNETLFAKEAVLDSLMATSDLPAITAAEEESVREMLRRLDTYVRQDQARAMAVNYLTQLAQLMS
jgi:spermidine synthase